MIPVTNDSLQNDIEIEQLPTRTYALNFSDPDDLRIAGFVDGSDAMKQAVYKILNTERYENLIYSWNYASELMDLFGEPTPFVYPEIKRLITEALVHDERITSVDEFTFTAIKGKVGVTFTVHSTEGDFTAEKVVNL